MEGTVWWEKEFSCEELRIREKHSDSGSEEKGCTEVNIAFWFLRREGAEVNLLGFWFWKREVVGK